VTLTILAAGGGCATSGSGSGSAAPASDVGGRSGPSSLITQRALALDRLRTRPVGRGPRFDPPPRGRPVAAAANVGALACGSAGALRYGAHLELFAADRVVIVPAGIGVSPPLRREGARVLGGRCVYPLSTSEPTGVIEVRAGGAHAPALTVGDLFAVWGQRLGPHRLGAFRSGTPVTAYVSGRRWRGDPRSVPLAPHAQIVIESGPHVDPHPSYRFAPGL